MQNLILKIPICENREFNRFEMMVGNFKNHHSKLYLFGN